MLSRFRSQAAVSPESVGWADDRFRDLGFRVLSGPCASDQVVQHTALK